MLIATAAPASPRPQADKRAIAVRQVANIRKAMAGIAAASEAARKTLDSFR